MDEMKVSQPLDESTKWREDFPVDEVQEHYIERRDFTKFLLLISGSFVVGQIYIGIQNIFRRTAKGYPVKKIASIGDLKINGFVSFTYPGKNDTCLLMRLSDTHFVAYSNKCTHLMCPVLPQMDKKQLYCPCHAGYFDMLSGAPLSGPPPRALARVKLKFMNGDIFAEGMEA